jgi:hypothetical protein
MNFELSAKTRNDMKRVTGYDYADLSKIPLDQFRATPRSLKTQNEREEKYEIPPRACPAVFRRFPPSTPSTFFRKVLTLIGVTGGGSPSTRFATLHLQSADTQSVAGGRSRFAAIMGEWGDIPRFE